MQRYPIIATDAEDAYRRERATEQLHHPGGRTHRSDRSADRARRRRRRNLVAD
jgi:hypothetical protein